MASVSKRAFLVWFAGSAAAALAQQGELPAVESFSPEGEIRSVQQIAIRFSHEMVKLGEAGAEPPVTWRCEGAATGRATTRWVDSRRWVAEFPQPLPVGLRCEAQLREGLRSMAGTAVARPQQAWRFTTGGPKVDWSYPVAGSKIKEDQVFLLRSSVAVAHDTLVNNIGCVTGAGSRPATVLTHEQARAAFDRARQERLVHGTDFSPATTFAATCGERLASDTPVRLVWGKDIATPRGVSSQHDQSVGNYAVRSPFSAQVRCTQLEGAQGCDPRLPVRVEFNEDLPLAQLAQVAIRDAAGAAVPVTRPRNWLMPDRGREVGTDRSAAVPVPAEGTVLTVSLPEELSDIDGRPISNRKDFPHRVQLAMLPPYVGFPQSSRVLHLRPGTPALWPLAVRRTEKSVPVKLMRIGGEGRDDTVQGDPLAARAAASASAAALWRSAESWPQSYEMPLRPHPVIAQQQRKWAVVEVQDVPAKGGAMEFVPLTLAEPGLYLAEAHSSAFAEHLVRVASTPGIEQRAPRQRASLVIVTNLNIVTRFGDAGQSLVWVTALDSGLPVAGAEVDVLACDGKALAQGDTDANGLLAVNLPARDHGPACPGRYGAVTNQAVVVVRKGKDLALLAGQIGTYHYGSANRYSMGHTIMDRMLFKPGETVHMQHMVRKMAPTGFDALGPGAGKVELRFERELVAALPLVWDGAGQAVSQWQVPTNARLGQYSATVVGPDGSTHVTQLAVEEFRAPVFEAALGGAARWAAGKQTLHADLRLAYLAGGAAVGQKVEVLGRYDAGAEPPVPGYAFADATLAYVHPIPMKPIDAQLDAKGARLLAISPPVLDRPSTLHAEMKFTDPNGEVQTVTRLFPLWSADTRLGVRVTARPGPAVSGTIAVVQGMALDAGDKRLAGRKVEMLVQPAVLSYSNGQRVETLGPPAQVCKAVTDSQGATECELAELPVIPETQQSGYGSKGWLFRVNGADSLGKPITSSVFRHEYELRSGASAQLLTLDGSQPAPPDQPARLTVRAPFLPATLLLTVERESVLHAAVHHLTQPVTALTVPVRPELAPNVQVHARFVRGLSGLGDLPANNPPAMSASRVLSLPIAPARFALDVQVEPAAAVLPTRSTLTVKVSAVQSRNGAAAAGAKLTLVAVDEALLALKGNSSWKVLDSMMRVRGIQVNGSAMESLLARSLVFGAQPAFWPPDDRGRSVSAAPAPAPPAAMKRSEDESEGAASHTMRNQFSTLAFWTTEAVLDAHGQASVAVPFNDSITRWRVVAVVLHGADQFGTGEATVRATRAVQIFSGLPPVVRSGDTLTQQVTVRNSGPKPVSVQLRARGVPKADEGTQVMEDISVNRSVRLAPGQAQQVAWTVAVPQGVQALAWRIVASMPDGTVADAIEVEQLARPALPVTVRQATLLRIDGKATVSVVMPANAQPGLGGVGVTLQDSLVNASLGEMRRWMSAYPYGCLEQLSSRIVVAGDAGAWDRLMSDLPKYLDQHGLVRYFPEASLPGSEMLTAHLLDMAAAKGWKLPAASRERMLSGLHQVLLGRLPGQDWLPTGSAEVARLLALQATLAEQRTLKDTAPLPVRPDDLGSLPVVALTDWVRALLAQAPGSRSEGDLRAAAAFLRSRYDVQGTRLNWRSESDENWWWFMWSGDVAAARTALVLQHWQAVDPSWKSDVPLVIAGLVGRQRQGRWSTTVANAWATVALQRFAATAEAVPVGGGTQLSLASDPKAVQALVWPNPRKTLLRPAPGLAGDTVVMTHQGSGAPWAIVSMNAAVRLAQPHNAGMRVEKTVTAVEQKVKGRWSAGDVARVRLTMHSQADLTWVVVRDPVPSGATILGRGLARESTLAQAGEREGAVWPSFAERGAESYSGYYRWVPRGSWSTEYSVRINNAGRFSFPATRVEAMYAPEIFAETPNADWVVHPSSAR